MSLDRRLLDLLCCPVSKLPLSLIDNAAVARLQVAAKAGLLRGRDGATVADAPVAALLEARSGWYYPIEDDIPVLLPESALRVVDHASSEQVLDQSRQSGS